MLQTNVVGPFLVTKHFLPQLKKKNTKVVVNTSSICGSISANASGAFKGLLLPYNSSKAAINMRESPRLFSAPVYAISLVSDAVVSSMQYAICAVLQIMQSCHFQNDYAHLCEQLHACHL